MKERQNNKRLYNFLTRTRKGAAMKYGFDEKQDRDWKSEVVWKDVNERLFFQTWKKSYDPFANLEEDEDEHEENETVLHDE